MPSHPEGLSIKRLLTNPGAMRSPHWHGNSNADDIGTDATREFIARHFAILSNVDAASFLLIDEWRSTLGRHRDPVAAAIWALDPWALSCVCRPLPNVMK